MILPSPFALRNQIGTPENFFIHDGYRPRLDNKQFDDRELEGEFQREVYQYARQVLDEHRLKRVLDVGCGSGFKLITNFFDCDTFGIDLPDTIAFLNQRWPGRRWSTSFPEESPELLICADVIEHVENPNVLLHSIRAIAPQYIILSTPERGELCLGTDDGPPKNLHHVREWNFAQFHAYIESWFRIREHFVIRGTQCLECELLSPAC